MTDPFQAPDARHTDVTLGALAAKCSASLSSEEYVQNRDAYASAHHECVGCVVPRAHGRLNFSPKGATKLPVVFFRHSGGPGRDAGFNPQAALVLHGFSLSEGAVLPGKIISSDGHVYEPADLWTSRMQAGLRDKAPRILQRDGEDWWAWDETFIVGAGAGAQTGLRFEHPERLTLGDKFENVRPGGYDPEARIEDLDLDGVWAEVVYPTAGLGMHKTVPDSRVFSDICRAYNDWLAEFCGAHPDRLKGIAMLNIDNVVEGVAELERARKIGLIGATITVGPPADKPYDSPMYEPLWASAVDLDMPLGLHTGTHRRVQGGFFIDAKDAKPSAISTREYPVRVSLADMIFSGVFERHPKLRVGTVEYELGWIPSFLERMDYTYTQGIRRKEWMRFKGETIPSDFFRQNGFCSFQQDVAGLRDRETIGLNALMWGSDYPHFESTFPRSRTVLEHMFQGVSDEDTARVLGGNAAQLYQIGTA